MQSEIEKEERPPALALPQARPGVHHGGFIWKVKRGSYNCTCGLGSHGLKLICRKEPAQKELLTLTDITLQTYQTNGPIS